MAVLQEHQADECRTQHEEANAHERRGDGRLIPQMHHRRRQLRRGHKQIHASAEGQHQPLNVARHIHLIADDGPDDGGRQGSQTICKHGRLPRPASLGDEQHEVCQLLGCLMRHGGTDDGPQRGGVARLCSNPDDDAVDKVVTKVAQEHWACDGPAPRLLPIDMIMPMIMPTTLGRGSCASLCACTCSLCACVCACAFACAFACACLWVRALGRGNGARLWVRGLGRGSGGGCRQDVRAMVNDESKEPASHDSHTPSPRGSDLFFLVHSGQLESLCKKQEECTREDRT
mmetsp:Transcript_135577/g.432664  ORF Transcript_135577/g.432664 Transcript_135577/m.432664 type:complete len:288 (+) Transcript_135577:422-1285(+)